MSETIKDLGVFKPNKTITTTFQADKNKTIRFISRSCTCLSEEFDKETNIVTVSFKGGAPSLGRTFIETIRSVTVYYTDSTTDLFKFKVRIEK